MNSITNRQPKLLGNITGLIVSLALCLLVGGIGGAITSTTVDSWYQTLQKPAFNPPDWLFAPVWTILYVMMAIAAWRVWRRVGFSGGWKALTLFILQLWLNLVWSFLFFGLSRMDLALLEIIILLIVIITNGLLFWRIGRSAGLLFTPYVLWVFYATLLNFSLLMMNSP